MRTLCAARFLTFAIMLTWPMASMADRQECENTWVTSAVDFSFANSYSQNVKVNYVNRGRSAITKVRMTFTQSGNVYEESVYSVAPQESDTVWIDVLPEDMADGARASLVGLRAERKCKSVITLSTGQGFKGSVTRLGKYEIDDLLIQHFQHIEGGTNTQYLELSGGIGPDSTFYVEGLLRKSNGAITNVFLNSAGGVIKDGIALGETINKYGAKVWILPDANCASSCAIAFLAADKRGMEDGASLSFHSPYYKVKDGYRCTEVRELKSLFTRQLGVNSGTFAYGRMMDFCGPTQAWTLNRDAADLTGMLNQGR